MKKVSVGEDRNTRGAIKIAFNPMFTYYPEQNVLSSSVLSSIISGFTTRKAGDMRKIQIIKNFFQQNEIAPRKIVKLEQIHSVNISIPDTLHLGDVEILEESDGVITQEKGVMLTVHTADCVPILFYDPVGQIIGASHQGWRGSVKNMVANMIMRMTDLGSNPIHIQMSIGPAIGMCCYTVDMDRHILFMEEMERFEKHILKPHGGEFLLNLARLNYELALEAGLPRRNIDYFPFCTSCDDKRFYSYRRQYKKYPAEFGEMMGYIMM
ncbi:peptidoglycan editing factor PgeF [Candidatus Roizmanbacteria bacterium CG03_land_8_20_14_0_80_39_12]|uniref:Purine nucleoside phosphorylase n=1 Tax=Candidatus Roizmanbacteria bacterium CG03_land_8_20_14_0_80_39_12 TaxID=1974847 RepID=A0A2M7BRZ8_9BACT|nr:MAG: peptidoglycan editing factor PgeF [Candidatus Roizmanbacteria bacterium CG03_land_8_20_14_0_80_39_12]